jgi:hypothetical protein
MSENIIKKAIGHLELGDVKQAYSVAKEIQKNQLIDGKPKSPFAINLPDSQQINFIELILDAKPQLLSGLSKPDLIKIRLSTALWQLGFSESTINLPLVDFAGLSPLSNQRLRLLIFINSRYLENLAQFKRIGIKRLELVSSGNCCQNCQSYDGQEIALEDALEAPNPDCLEIKDGVICGGLICKPVINFDD